MLRKELRQCYRLIDDDSELCNLDTDVLHSKIIEKYVPSPTILCRAQLIILENRISLVPEQKCFAITSTSADTHCVTLFSGENGDPNQYCTCPGTMTCSHILTAMMAIGYVPRQSKGWSNGTRTRRNIKSSKSGTKFHPRSSKANRRRNGYKKLQRIKKQESKVGDDIFSMNRGREGIFTIGIRAFGKNNEKQILIKETPIPTPVALILPILTGKDNSKVLAEESRQQPPQENIIQFQEKQDDASSMLEDLTQLSEKPQVHSGSPKKHRKIERSFFHDTFVPDAELKNIITPKCWLSDVHMDAVSTILRKQFKDIGGSIDPI
ncbi:hypothetical protein OUZ56_026063 [Daphnia magna]|uniref:SWIM-type domain-containing protein n=1 Tax=Daphnia magna TaxID=35525 RepID=A0ABQ9ZM19_9CRUS|nr:hypothetical protein OUZ56_026063 [Daphnia magna]